MGFPGGSVVKNPSPGVGATWDAVQFLSLGQEHPPEEKMATYSSILAWEIPWTEEPGRFQSMGSQKSQAGLSDWACTHTSSKVYVLDPVADSSTFMPAQTISLSHPQGFHSQCQQWVYLGHATKFLLMRNQSFQIKESVLIQKSPRYLLHIWTFGRVKTTLEITATSLLPVWGSSWQQEWPGDRKNLGPCYHPWAAGSMNPETHFSSLLFTTDKTLS